MGVEQSLQERVDPSRAEARHGDGKTLTTVTLIIPVYNEAAYLDQVLTAVTALPFKPQVIAVDDGSSDESPRVLERWQQSDGIVFLQHDRNRGKGAAIRTGLEACTGDIMVIQDADMEYDPLDIESLIKPIQDGYADAVYGSRLKGGRPQRVHLFWHLVGNRLLSLITNILYNTTLSDMETGYKAIKTDLARSLQLEANDFRLEPEITAKLLMKHARIFEVPISYYGRSYEEGKKITWRDGIPALVTLVKLRFKR